MIFIKIVLISLIFMTTSLIGNIKSKSFEKRYLELKNFKSGLAIFKSKLEFTYEPINEVFKDISKIVYDDKENVFKNFIENNDGNLAVESQENFENDDKEVIKSFGKMLGKLDKSGQLSEINLADEFLDKQIENAFAVKEKNEKLYKVLGRSVGIAIAIIFIWYKEALWI